MKQITIRLTEDIIDKIKEKARENSRNFSKELRTIMESYFYSGLLFSDLNIDIEENSDRVVAPELTRSVYPSWKAKQTIWQKLWRLVRQIFKDRR